MGAAGDGARRRMGQPRGARRGKVAAARWSGTDGVRRMDAGFLALPLFIVLTSYLCEGSLQGNRTEVKFKGSAAAILITLATRTCFDVTYGDTARPWRQCHFSLDTAKAMIQFCKHNDSSSGEGNV